MNEGKRGYKVVKHMAAPKQPVKHRNPVAKNANAAIGGGGAGAHKDKKKAAKQGDTKHKKSATADMMEGAAYDRKLELMLNIALVKKQIKEMRGYYNPMDQERDQQRQMDYDKKEFKRQELQHELGHEDEWEKQRQSKPQVVAWVFYDVKPGQEDQAAMYKIRQLKNGKWAMPEYDKSGRTYAFHRNEADKLFGPGKRWVPKNEGVAEADSPAQQAAIAIAMKKAGKKPKTENSEYDDEAGMAKSNLHTLARAVNGLMKTIDSNDNLPEWCQEKIAKAEGMLVGVWDYLLSQKEQGINPSVK
jgi:hypothetical protein